MKKTIVVLGALLATACIADQKLLQPLFTAEDAVREPALAGTWTSEDPDPVVLTIRAAEDGYELRTSDKGVASRPLSIRLGRIGGELYWDATAGPAEQADVREEHLLPLHSVARLRMAGDRLVVAPLRSDWVKAALEDATLDIPYLLVDDEPLLTGSTAQLQLLLLEHANDPGAFAQDPASAGDGDDDAGDPALVLRRTPAATPRTVATDASNGR
jgi:hypothetical protein